MGWALSCEIYITSKAQVLLCTGLIYPRMLYYVIKGVESIKMYISINRLWSNFTKY